MNHPYWVAALRSFLTVGAVALTACAMLWVYQR